MYDKTEHKIKVVQSKDPKRFQNDYNAATKELSGYDVSIDSGFKDGYFYALFTYGVNIPTPETISDEFKLAGISHTCSECPYLEIGNDNRKKVWPCRYSEYGTSSKDAPACDVLLKKLMRGTVRLRNTEGYYDD